MAESLQAASSKMRPLGTDPKDLAGNPKPIVAKVHTLTPETGSKPAPRSFSDIVGGDDDSDPLTLDSESSLLSSDSSPPDEPVNHPVSSAPISGESEKLIDVDLIDEPRVRQRWYYDELAVQDMARKILKEGDGDVIKGQIQPIIVRPNPLEPGRYLIVEGLTRLHSFRRHLMAKKIKAIVKLGLDDLTGYFHGYRANEDRNPLTPYDKGMSFAALLEQGIAKDQEQLITESGENKQVISALLSFAKLPPSVHEIIERAKDKFGYNHAARLSALLSKTGDEEKVKKAAEKVASGSWTYAKLNSYVSSAESGSSASQRVRKVTKPIENLGKMKYGEGSLELSLDNIPVGQESAFAEAIENAIRKLKDTPPIDPPPKETQGG